jgi:hypothetical protein
VVRDAAVRVYVLAARNPEQTYACLLQSGRRLALGVGHVPRERIAPVALAGTVVAYADTIPATDTSHTTVMTLDMHGASPPVSRNATTPFERPESFSAVTDLVVTSRRSLAWIAKKGSIGKAAIFEVHRARASAQATLLDAGASVLPGSLRLTHGREIRWRNGARLRTARLP